MRIVNLLLQNYNTVTVILEYVWVYNVMVDFENE